MSSEQTVFLFIGAIFMVIVMLIWWTWYRLEDNDIPGEETVQAAEETVQAAEETGHAEVGPGQAKKETGQAKKETGQAKKETGQADGSPGQADGSPGQDEPPQLRVEIVKDKPIRSLVSSFKKGKATLVGRVQTLVKPPRENEESTDKEKEVTIDKENKPTIVNDQEKEPGATNENQDGVVVVPRKGGLLSTIQRGVQSFGKKKRKSIGDAMVALETDRDPTTSRKRKSSRERKRRGRKNQISGSDTE